MQYIQIDNFNDTINIVCKSDGSGESIVFNTLKEAEDTLEENCQDGIIVPLGNFMKVLKDASAFINIIKFEEGEEVGGDLEERINEFLQ